MRRIMAGLRISCPNKAVAGFGGVGPRGVDDAAGGAAGGGSGSSTCRWELDDAAGGGSSTCRWELDDAAGGGSGSSTCRWVCRR